MTPIGRPARSRHVGHVGRLDQPMTTPMTTAPTRASRPIVVYWRRTNASAPSRIVSPTATISGVPVSRDMTSRAR